MNKHSRFIASALEELSQEAGVTSVATPAVQNSEAGDSTTQVNIDTSKDAVAELMEKNSELLDTNATLESESFDNDLDAIETSSDTVQSDLDEAVSAGIALEQLCEIIDASVRTGQANPTSIAGFAMALEQISHRAKLTNPIPALEAETLLLEGPGDKAKSIGAAAAEKAGEIAKRLIDGIKRIIGWFMNMIRTFMSSSKAIGERARKVRALVDSIDEGKTITSQPFIASLRLVEGGADAPKQFEEYGHMATKALYGFFNHSFVDGLSKAMAEFNMTSEEERAGMEGAVRGKLSDILKVLMSTVYPENGSGADVAGAIPAGVGEDRLTVGKTTPCVGGIQLYLAATIGGNSGAVKVAGGAEEPSMFVRSGLAKEQPKIAAPESIPCVPRNLAKQMLTSIEGWVRDQKELEKVFGHIQSYKPSQELSWPVANMYLSVLTALASGCVPHLLRLNMKNAASFIAYVEKSAAVSKGVSEDAPASREVA